MRKNSSKIGNKLQFLRQQPQYNDRSSNCCQLLTKFREHWESTWPYKQGSTHLVILNPWNIASPTIQWVLNHYIDIPRIFLIWSHSHAPYNCLPLTNGQDVFQIKNCLFPMSSSWSWPCINAQKVSPYYWSSVANYHQKWSTTPLKWKTKTSKTNSKTTISHKF